MPFKKLYLWCIGLTFAFGVAAALPLIGLILLFFLPPVALLGFQAWTILFYLAFLAPTYAIKDEKRAMAAAMAGVAAAAVIGYGVPVSLNLGIERTLSLLRSTPTKPSMAPVRSVGMTKHSDRNKSDQTLCDARCEHLLLNRLVDEVVMVPSIDTLERQSSFRLVRQPGCSSTNTLPVTFSTLDYCIVVGAPSKPPEAWILERNLMDAKSGSTAVQLTIWRSDGNGAYEVVGERAAWEVQKYSIPLRFMPVFSGRGIGTFSGIEMVTSFDRGGPSIDNQGRPIDWGPAVIGALGLNLKEEREMPLADLIELYDRLQVNDRNNLKNSVAAKVLSRMKETPALSDAEIQLFEKVAPHFVRSITTNWTVASTLMGKDARIMHALARSILADPKISPQERMFLLDELPDQARQAYRTPILEFMSEHLKDGHAGSYLGSIKKLGSFGPDAIQLLRDLLRSPDGRVRHSALTALCSLADPGFQDQLATIFEDMAEETQAENLRLAGILMRKAGQAARAEALLAPHGIKVPETSSCTDSE